MRLRLPILAPMQPLPLNLRATFNPHRWVLPVDLGLCAGPAANPFMFGGVGMAAAVTVGRPLIWASAHYLGFAPILRQIRAEAVDWERFLRAAITAYFEYLVAERDSRIEHMPHGSPHVLIETPETQAVFQEVRASILEQGALNGVIQADPEYMTAAGIGVAREIGERMLLRDPVDVQAAVAFTVGMILGGLGGLRS